MKNKAVGYMATPIATCLGAGYAPLAPGSAASLGAVGLGALLVKYYGWKPGYFALLAAVALLPGIWAAHFVAKESGQHDPGKIVVDEVVGQWITLAGATVFVWQSWLAAFLLFRLLDIWKPFPCRKAEDLPGGFGIMADDVIAGIYGALVLFTAGCFNLY